MIFRSFKKGHRPDYFLLVLFIILTIAGLVILSSASSELGKIKFNDSYYYLKHQIENGLLLGLLGFGVGFFIHYQFYRKISIYLLGINIVLLLLIFMGLGVSGGGASRWLKVGPALFQPSELLKLTFILYLGAWLNNPKLNRGQGMHGFIPFLAICGGVAILLILQPATSTVAILMTAGFVIYFMSGAKIRYLLSGLGLGALALAVIVMITPYRMQRVLNYLNPSKDTQGTGYQLNQALIAIGSGGLRGVGYGQSASKSSSLPTPMDDSIFAVAANELGFIGASLLILTFGLVVFRMLWLARQVRDGYGKLVLIGFATIIGMQSLVNMGAISGLLPLTGVPLPFISYGGTALAVFLTMAGISLNISKYA